MRVTIDELRMMLPADKSDQASAERLLTLGYPTVAPILPELLTWIQDGNWPIARTIAALLETVGPPLLPELRRVLQTNDDVWKYFIFVLLLDSRELVSGLREELRRIADAPTPGEKAEALDQLARQRLAAHV